jgi:hypothetical protein
MRAMKDHVKPINPIVIEEIKRAMRRISGRFICFDDDNFPIIIEKIAKEAYWRANISEKREKDILSDVENQVTREGRVFIAIENPERLIISPSSFF